MKKNYILLAIIIGLLLFVNNVKASYIEDYNLPRESDYERIFNEFGLDNASMVCVYTNNTVYCYKGNQSFTPRFYVDNNIRNTNNPDGFYLNQYVWYWQSTQRNYGSQAILKWVKNAEGNEQEYLWNIECLSDPVASNLCINNVPITNDYYITYYKSYNQTNPYPLVKTDIWYTQYHLGSVYYNGIPSITFPSIEYKLFVEGEQIKLNYKIISWEDSLIDYFKTGPILTKTFTREEFLNGENEFDIVIRFPSTNKRVPIEYYDSRDTLIETKYIDLEEIMEEMPQDQVNEIIAQEEYQKDIYQWESGDYSNTIKNTINDSSSIIKWARDLVQYIFDSFPSEVKYVIISLFIVFLITCIMKMIWR